MTVNYDFDPRAEFADLKIYDWVPGPRKPTGDPRIDDNSLLDARIRKSVEEKLAARGFVKRASGKPDFWVTYHVTLDRGATVDMLNDDFGYGPGWGWSYGYAYRPDTWYGQQKRYAYEYDEGTLLLDVVDPRTRQLIWRSSATDEVNFSASPEAKERQINEAVRRMLANFPPKR